MDLQRNDSNLPSRRALLKGAALVGATAMIGCANGREDADNVARTAAGPSVPRSNQTLRFVHMTDIHVQPERRAGDGFAQALQSLLHLDPAPQFILTGGDHIMGSMRTSRDRAVTQWDLYEKVVRENSTVKIYPCIGNHDIWGWGDPAVPSSDGGYGKGLAMERLGMKESWYSFDAGGWHFIVLDNIARRDHFFCGDLGELQLDWLRADLEKSNHRPTVVTSHLPVLAASVFFNGHRLKDTAWEVPDTSMMRRSKEIVDLLKRHNVRLLLSGHTHLVDEVKYLGMTFINDGAVSGGWWRGPHQEFQEGYGVIDLNPDGTFRHIYRTYGWKAVKDPKPPTTAEVEETSDV